MMLLALAWVAVGYTPPHATPQARMKTRMSADDQAMRQARRQAILEASERAAQRMMAVKNGQPHPATLAKDVETPLSVPPPPPPQAPMPKAARPGDGPVGKRPPKIQSHEDIAARLDRAPNGYQPYYNTGDGYLNDLASDSSSRHWTKSPSGSTRGLESIKKQLGARPGQVTTAPYDDAIEVKTVPDVEKTLPAIAAATTVPRVEAPVPEVETAAPAPVTRPEPVQAARFPSPADAVPAPAPVVAPPAPAKSIPLDDKDRAAISRAIAGLLQYVQAVQTDAPMPAAERAKLVDQLKLVRDIFVRDAETAPPAASPVIAAVEEKPKEEPVVALAPPEPVVDPPKQEPVVALAPPEPVAAPAEPVVVVVEEPVAKERDEPKLVVKAEPKVVDKPVTSNFSLISLDCAGVAARVAAISPCYSQFAEKIKEFACDGAFLASLSPQELQETLFDIGVDKRLQRRRIAFELGLFAEHD